MMVVPTIPGWRQVRAVVTDGNRGDTDLAEEARVHQLFEDRTILWEENVAQVLEWSDSKTNRILTAMEEAGYLERYWNPHGTVVIRPPTADSRE